ncbi:MAG: Fe-S cluster assembly protein SufD [Gammaproteobacteria bacterium]
MINYSEQLKDLIKNDTSWLTILRQSALHNFDAIGFPTTHDEAWKYTRTLPIENKNFAMVYQSKPSIRPETLTLYNISSNYYQAVFVNGVYQETLSTLPKNENDLIIQPISYTLKNSPDLLKQHLKQHQQHGYSALNTAFFQEGLFIHLPDNLQLDKPLHLLFFVSSPTEPVAFNTRNIVVAGKNSQASLVEHYVGVSESPYFTNTITDIFCDDSAFVNHYKIQQESLHGYHIGTTFAELSKNSEFNSVVISTGGSLVRSDTNINLHQHSTCSLDGLFLAQKKQHMDFHTKVDHAFPETQSSEFYKGIIADQARGVFHGKVIVHQNAQKSDAKQQSKNLLLSDSAEVDTKPELEIYADDVKCSHGATVGQLEDSSLFYLRSRGLDLEEAKKILIYAFAREIIDRVEDNALKAYLGKLV